MFIQGIQYPNLCMIKRYAFLFSECQNCLKNIKWGFQLLSGLNEACSLWFWYFKKQPPEVKQPPEECYEKLLFQISQNSQENTCVGVSFLIKLQVWGLHKYWKRNFIIGVFFRILQNFLEQLFYRTPTINCFYAAHVRRKR